MLYSSGLLDSWENAELVILTHGVVKSATLPIPPMAFNIENIGKNCFCSFFSKYVIFRFLHFLLIYCLKDDGLRSVKIRDTFLLKTRKNRVCAKIANFTTIWDPPFHWC